VLKKSKDYWLNKLSGEIPIINLPADYKRPAVLTDNGNVTYFEIESNMLEQINQFCKEKNVTLFMTITAVLKLLLYRYTGQEHIIVGTPVVTRPLPELDQQIGMYLNTIPLSDHIEPDMTFNNFLQAVRQTALDGYDNSLYQFDVLLEDLSLSRDTSRHPVFDIMIVLQN